MEKLSSTRGVEGRLAPDSRQPAASAKTRCSETDHLFGQNRNLPGQAEYNDQAPGCRTRQAGGAEGGDQRTTPFASQAECQGSVPTRVLRLNINHIWIGAMARYFAEVQKMGDLADPNKKSRLEP